MEMFILSNGTILEYVVGGDNCRIKDSYLVKSKKLKLEFIDFLCKRYPEFGVRSAKSYYREWKSHNILYKLHIKRSSTCDTDLCITEYLKRRICYFIIAMFGIDW